MKSKTLYDFVLWAIPRFHRAGAAQKQPQIGYFPDARPGQALSGPAPKNAGRTIGFSTEASERLNTRQ
jgi:hypothetical protein